MTPAFGKSLFPGRSRHGQALLGNSRAGRESSWSTSPVSQAQLVLLPPTLLLPVLPVAAPGGPPATGTASMAAQGLPGRTSDGCAVCLEVFLQEPQAICCFQVIWHFPERGKLYLTLSIPFLRLDISLSLYIYVCVRDIYVHSLPRKEQKPNSCQGHT